MMVKNIIINMEYSLKDVLPMLKKANSLELLAVYSRIHSLLKIRIMYHLFLI